MGHHKLTKYSNFWCPRDEVKMKGIGNIFNEIIDESFTRLENYLHTRYRKLRNPQIDILQKGFLCGTYSQTIKSQRIFKTGKVSSHLQGNPNQKTLDFSVETL